MALITLSEELKANFSSVDNDYNVSSLESFIKSAESNLVAPVIGQAILGAVQDAYSAGGVAGNMAKLLLLLQESVTHLAFLQAADSGSFRIGDSGFYVISTSDAKPVSDKKMSEFKRERREWGFNALERAVTFLEDNINDAGFAVYKASDEHLQNRAYFINTAIEFTRRYKKANNSAYLFNQLKDALGRAERKYIRPVLGNAFFNALKAKILANNLNADDKLLLPYINRALANYTIALGLPGLQVEISGQQILISSSPAYGNSENVENKAAASPDQINSAVGAAYATGDFELEELEQYLLDNAGSFGAYIVPEASEDFNINDPADPTYFV